MVAASVSPGVFHNVSVTPVGLLLVTVVVPPTTLDVVGHPADAAAPGPIVVTVAEAVAAVMFATVADEVDTVDAVTITVITVEATATPTAVLAASPVVWRTSSTTVELVGAGVGSTLSSTIIGVGVTAETTGTGVGSSVSIVMVGAVFVDAENGTRVSPMVSTATVGASVASVVNGRDVKVAVESVVKEVPVSLLRLKHF